jgi:excinuclease UvrABC ATPase subunit
MVTPVKTKKRKPRGDVNTFRTICPECKRANTEPSWGTWGYIQCNDCGCEFVDRRALMSSKRRSTRAQSVIGYSFQYCPYCDGFSRVTQLDEDSIVFKCNCCKQEWYRPASGFFADYKTKTMQPLYTISNQIRIAKSVRDLFERKTKKTTKRSVKRK